MGLIASGWDDNVDFLVEYLINLFLDDLEMVLNLKSCILKAKSWRKGLEGALVWLCWTRQPHSRGGVNWML